MKPGILAALPEAYPWKDSLHCYSSIESTSDHLRSLARQGAPHGTAVIAAHQTNGHGRRGRSFHSPEGKGIYLSILLRPNCAALDLMHLTCAVAVAMCDAVEAAASLRPGIKWTNDLVYGKRKLGGILTELGFRSDGTVDYAIIGIGINCLQKPEDFPPEIRDIAASLAMVTDREVPPESMAAAMLEALHRMDGILLSEKRDILSRYRENCITIGQEISLLRGDAVRYGTALSVDDDGALVVAFRDGTVQTVNSGEVSVRGMYGYV